MFWERHPSSINYPPDDDYYFRYLANKRPKHDLGDIFNPALNVQEKGAASVVLPSVVALVSDSGNVEVSEGSGTVIESNNARTIVLTTANLIRRPTDGAFVENHLIDDLKVIVYYRGGGYAGEVVAFDYHYNLAAISFQPQVPLPTAKIAVVDDSLDVPPSLPSFELRPHANLYKLRPGAEVVAVGRFFYKPFGSMVVPGAYWLDRCRYDSKELLKASCTIIKCGEGGPLVNLFGEVIGITYCDRGSTPFMPISIVLKWWEHFKTYRKYRRPLLGMEAGNFYSADIDVIERVNQLFPSVCSGVFVEMVKQGSSADLAGLCVNDVIIECVGKRVKSFLEFFEMIWENVGNHVNLVVVRQHKVEPLHLTMFVNEATVDQFNRWPNRI
ncbi:Protease Do-like 14-like protein [Heracleum sosnowskyi]|uniref:Protease Do-like 14-like protein n=1 Tax=Heracleum sosnowskyi TaxID=360622 RepID=A0AAD8H9G3_9APIA|nr:Protease Do-like 14-like protein [Heracleum sosnowskyi]